MEPQKITELANLLRNNGDKILSSEFTLTLSGALLRALNDSFSLIAETAEIAGAPSQKFQVLKPNNSKSPVFRDLQLIYDFVQKTSLLCIVQYPGEENFEGPIDIRKFRALSRLEVQKINVSQVVGIQPLRGQLQQLVCTKSLQNVEDIITRCGGDKSNGFVWNELKIADFSYNNLKTVDSSLEFAQFLQHLNLRHNQLHSVEAIKWLPNLKTLDLSYNCLICIPIFHVEACKRLQSLNMSNNFVEDLLGIIKLDALTDLDLSDNCLLDHTYLLPLNELLTLKFLNLYGNPLHFHPRHRLATAQYLHKNTSTVKFILDLEPLSKAEKSVTGSQKLRHMGSLNHFVIASSTASVSSGGLTPASHTPSSSVGSLRSFKLQDNTESEDSINRKKARTPKVRTVEIEEKENMCIEKRATNWAAGTIAERKNSMTMSVIDEPDTEHLEAKKQIETLREKYGAEWLHSANAEMMHTMLGTSPSSTTEKADLERYKSHQIFRDFIDELSDQNLTISEAVSPIKQNPKNSDVSDSTLYMSSNEGNVNNNNNDTLGSSLFETATDTDLANVAPLESSSEQVDHFEERLRHAYSTSAAEESDGSDPEEDEKTYIVYTNNRNEAIFLTLSAKFLRERDALTERTKTKWSLKILESCERIKANTLRIQFDTLKTDKKERIYTVEDDFCQELEGKLRDILSRRDLSEMNQILYHCVNCSCHFARENKYRRIEIDVRCPGCGSTFVAEMPQALKSLERVNISYDKLSQALIIEESSMSTPLVLQSTEKHKQDNVDETASIGSATSLNESSSCSKITNSQSSFDSNQSVVGSSNTDRDNDFKSQCESDVDILSNPSQSSIEVLDQLTNSTQQRKTSSEERRLLHIPQLKTIEDDQSYTQTFIEREFSNIAKERQGKKETTSVQPEIELSPEPAKRDRRKLHSTPLVHLNLTESSSSGSVTDSICTAYEQAAKFPATELHDKIVINNMFLVESGADRSKSKEATASTGATVGMKREDSSISSMLGAFFQSTNLLMSSSKKPIEAEPIVDVKAAQPNDNCRPYKFNYSNFGEIDHRLKLYFYQTKFDEQEEHFKWLARGSIYNENTQTLCEGLVLMSTCKVYLMEAFAPQDDDVTKWLRHVVSVTVDRLECIQLLPWKIGLSFKLRGWGGFLLLLRDILRTDSLMLYFANNSLPSQCELLYQSADEIVKRLNAAVKTEQLKMCSLLCECEVTCDLAKRNFRTTALLTTDTHLYLSAENLSWLSLQKQLATESDLQLCMMQLMSNLVEVERLTANSFIINFLDETQNICELWQCTFETQENADSCFNAIDQSWEKIFGVPLLSA